MKIIFATNQDEKTEVSFRVINKLITSVNCVSCTDINATKQQLYQILNSQPNTSLFATGHGESDHIVGQDNLIALDENSLPLLKDRHIFAFCCWTANELGKSVQKEVASYWGYSGQLILHDYEELDAEMLEILTYLYHHFDANLDKSSIEMTINVLQEKCGTLYEDILQQYADDFELGYGIIMSAATSFRCVWARLRVHSFVTTDTIKHKDAIEDILY